MSAVYLPVGPGSGMTSAERADALDAEVWRLIRPESVQGANDSTHLYPRMVHPTTGQSAILGDTTENIPINEFVDLTVLLALLPDVPQAEKDGLVMFIDANRGGSIPFGQLIPSTSIQLTEAEAQADGWIEDTDEP